MEARLARSSWNMDAGNLVSIEDASGWTVIFEQGRAWLTLEGSSQDKQLNAGERFVIPGSGHMVIEADRASRIRLEPPPASALSRVSAGLLTGTRQIARALLGATVYSAERTRCRPAR
ncbi:DUF2917 domain-containing protein [Aromatoleum diolicum]|uniref:DUF2917 domain-containing protein n=1 Tax=Aromatoleum diolicum TaxID=75796 RepID=A0ABX1QG64_9RHOO|nr:DUF2917 domain-containing protein [Aromatoleum diolicum]NMG76980.1 DUF2917 domain-containing protein [Aromatoleum diolicum]